MTTFTQVRLFLFIIAIARAKLYIFIVLYTVAVCNIALQSMGT